jgi:DMSO reductase anchor subunit
MRPYRLILIGSWLYILSISYTNAQTGYISPYINTLSGNKIAKQVSNLISILSAGMSLLFAFQIFQKMQAGDEDVGKKIFVWLSGFILLFLGSMIVSWFFFNDTETVKVFQP